MGWDSSDCWLTIEIRSLLILITCTIPINQLMDSLVVHILREITFPRSATVVSLSQPNNRNGLVLNYRVCG